ncbi:MAG: protein kinase [Kofleriaceae bacterium]|nr:protein kinase [Kofleriaceae bacterium]
MTAASAGAGPRTLGRYELIASIGSGGMAEVHLARQRGPMGFEKLVVVKTIHQQLASKRAFIDMLLEEARVAALVKHANVVDIYDLGEAGGEYFIAMEYLEGEPLLSLLYAGKQGQRLDVLSTARMIADSARGLHAAHEHHGMSGQPMTLIHHDVSPGNIVILFTGEVKLVDFGVAKAEDAVTEGGAPVILKGKVGYMAPEKVRHQPVDRRSDIFSLGVVMWEALTLRRLYRGDDEEAARAILAGSPPAPSEGNPDVPVELDLVCATAMAADPSARYPTAAAMAEAIEDVLRAKAYSGRNDAIATYMRKTFSDRLAARRALLQQIAASKAPTAGAIAAAFHHDGALSHTPTPAAPPAAVTAAPAAAPPVRAGLAVAAAAAANRPSAALPEPSAPAAAAAAPMGAGAGGAPANGAAKTDGAAASPRATQPPPPKATDGARAGGKDAGKSIPPPFRAGAKVAPQATTTTATAPADPALAATMPGTSLPGAHPAVTPMPPAVVASASTSGAHPAVTPMPPAVVASASAAGERASEPVALASTLVAAAEASAAAASVVTPSGADPAPNAVSVDSGGDVARAVAVVSPRARLSETDMLSAWVKDDDAFARLPAATGGYEVLPDDDRRRKVWWVVGITAAVLLGIVVIAALAGGGDEPARSVAAPTAGPRADAATRWDPGLTSAAVVADAGTDPALLAVDGVDAAVALARPDASVVAAAPPVDAAVSSPVDRPDASAAVAHGGGGKPGGDKPGGDKPGGGKPGGGKVTPAPGASADALTKDGMRLFIGGKHRDALAKFRLARASNRGYAPAYRGMGMAQQALGDKRGAASSFKTYLRLAPRAADAPAIRARLEKL